LIVIIIIIIIIKEITKLEIEEKKKFFKFRPMNKYLWPLKVFGQIKTKKTNKQNFYSVRTHYINQK